MVVGKEPYDETLLAVGNDRLPRLRLTLMQGFFYRPKVTDISEISFLSPGSDKI
jgi:hypothetical protein